jgi:hypothetical protein
VGGIELFALNNQIEPRQQVLQVPKHTFTARRSFIPATDSDEQLIAKHFSEAFQRSAHCGLTQKTSLGRPCNVFFL